MTSEPIRDPRRQPDELLAPCIPQGRASGVRGPDWKGKRPLFPMRPC
jgi:hypothetical protein